MPGYARPSTVVTSAYVLVSPTGDISATNLQDALTEIATEKATASSVSTLSTAVDNKANIVAGGAAITNSNTISADYTFTTNSNAVSAGPITIANGVTVTIATGAEWSVV